MGPPLMGVVRVDGSKNAALPLLAGAAALGRTVQVCGIPDSTDVQLMLDLLGPCGYRVARPVNQPGTAIVLPRPRGIENLPLPNAARIRASYYLVPALLASQGRANLPWPGGCSIGDRGMEVHFKVYAAFGDTVTTHEYGYSVTASTSCPHEVRIALPFRSRGAGVAAILRAVIGGHRLLLGNPNLSAETTALLDALTAAGWHIDARPEVLRVEPGGTWVESVSWSVPGDKIEAGTLACAIAATGGCGRIEGVRDVDITIVAGLLIRLGVPVFVEPDALIVCEGSRHTGLPLEAVASLAPGGLDADFEPSLMALALGRPGTHLFADTINPGRHGNLLPQLARLGAHIEELTPTECRLTGPQHLTGATVEATDIRTGSALLIAGLTAHGSTTVTGLDQLRRGHADLPAKLRTLGADIPEVPSR
ncbi:UDP-N-acetylglucosamine 1-carboxyvinyltransferase [Embleya sp. AB8]|uniref:UDP-N-acetylglucosamine 1-carboxyvinyltransferase n=1 Tax=Embleya sp. AB8 TaxID=3156304 RepID=UPI003C73FD0F